MQLSSIPKKIAAIFGASAPSTAINTVPLTQAGTTQPGQASFDVGFPAVTMQPAASGGINPYGQDFNGMLNAITAVQQWQSAGGSFPYDSSFSAQIGGYPKYAVLQKADGTGFWVSSVDSNTTDPDAGGAGWTDLAQANYALDTSTTANTLTAALSPAPTSLFDGMVVRINVKTTNTGASTLNLNSVGAKPILGLAGTALQGGELLANGIATFIWRADVSTWVLVDCTGGALQIAHATQSNHAVQFGQISGVVGQSRNATMNVVTASASATFSASELIVESALGGLRYCLANYSQTINLATTGAGGIDTGSAPVSGFVALYAIFNPATGATSILATNATSAVAPEVYGGANMPAGYIASGLISVWPTDSSGKFVIGLQHNRKICFTPATLLSTTASNVANVALSMSSAVPKNAVSVDVQGLISNTTSGLNTAALYVSSTPTSIGKTEVIGVGGNNTALTSINGNSPGLMMSVPQTLYYTTQGSGSTLITFTLSINAYTF